MSGCNELFTANVESEGSPRRDRPPARAARVRPRPTDRQRLESQNKIFQLIFPAAPSIRR